MDTFRRLHINESPNADGSHNVSGLDTDGWRPAGKLQPSASAEVLAASAGIQAHSKHNRPLVILSASRPNGSSLDYGRLRGSLTHRRFGYAECTGSYKGQQERSLIVEYGSTKELHQLIELAGYYGQESVLLISVARQAALYYLESNHIEMLGKLVPVSPQKAETLESWTRTKNGQYYGVE